MKSKTDEIIILPACFEHIESMINIAESCRLTAWKFDDYLDEINKNDSFGFVAANNISDGITFSIDVSGFIIMRLIRTVRIDSGNVIAAKLLKNDFQTLNNNEFCFSECEILNVAVRPCVRHKGIGQKLLDAVLEICFRHKIAQIWLEVRESNEAAIKFYRKNMFQDVYTRKDYYRDPVEDALVMKAELSAFDNKINLKT